MSPFLLGLIALVAFAANFVLCRIALHTTSIDPASFTTIRMLSAAVFLSLLVLFRSVRANSKLDSTDDSTTVEATEAATMQLSVPVIATFGGVVFLSEPLTTVFVVAACAILGGIFLVLKPSFNKL